MGLFSGVVQWGLFSGVVQWGCSVESPSGVVQWGCSVGFVTKGCDNYTYIRTYILVQAQH